MSAKQPPLSPLCQADDCTLVVVDMQTRLAQAMPSECFAAAVRNVGVLLQAADKLDVAVLATEQYPQGLGATLDEVAGALPGSADSFEKTCFSACGHDAFADTLARNGRRQVVIAGIEAHVCVLQTALQLQDRFAVFVVEDAVCSRSAANRANALARLRQAGVVITNTESVLFEWLRDAKHKHFKALTALIK